MINNIRCLLKAVPRLVVAGLLAMSLTGTATGTARAETTAKDVQLMLKAVSFLSSKPTGSLSVSVLFNPANPESVKDAEVIRSLLTTIKAGTIVPVSKAVELSQIATLDSPAAIVTRGLSMGELDEISTAVKARKVLTLSTDPDCAKTGKCVISIVSEPKVQVLYNGAAGQSTGVEFVPTFRMLITEL